MKLNKPLHYTAAEGYHNVICSMGGRYKKTPFGWQGYVEGSKAYENNVSRAACTRLDSEWEEMQSDMRNNKGAVGIPSTGSDESDKHAGGH